MIQINEKSTQPPQGGQGVGGMRMGSEMKKFRDETSSKMQVMRDSHKESMMSILTNEQKKFIESKQTGASTTPAKTK